MPEKVKRTVQDAEIDRQADLLYAFQFGQDFARSGDAAIEREFAAIFAGDAAAKAEFYKGLAQARRRLTCVH